MFQFPVIYDTMTVGDNLAFPLRNRGVAPAAIAARIAEVAAMLDLEPLMKRRASRLTADQKQKISLGRGLVREDVAAILFDEPLTVIDPHLKWLLRRKLKEVHNRFRHTLVYVTHDQNEALTFAEKVVVMYDGEVVQLGTPQELFERPAHRFVGYFIGSPGMNFLPCRLEDDGVRIDGTDAVLGGHWARRQPRRPTPSWSSASGRSSSGVGGGRGRDDPAGPGRAGRGSRQLQAGDGPARAAPAQGQARRGCARHRARPHIWLSRRRGRCSMPTAG